MNAKTEAAVIQHGENLLRIFPYATERDPVKLCKRLRKLEKQGEALALRLCNGPEFPSEDAADKIEAEILGKVDDYLTYHMAKVPVFLNRDPRGYALKIKESWMRERHELRLHRDWGGYGIIAPDLTEN